MGHWRKLFDNRFVGSWDLEGKESVTLTIKEVKIEELQSQRGKEKKPVVYFEGAQKGMVLNKTNAKAIADQYGSDTDKWAGKKVKLHAATCSVGGQEVECVRVKK